MEANEKVWQINCKVLNFLFDDTGMITEWVTSNKSRAHLFSTRPKGLFLYSLSEWVVTDGIKIVLQTFGFSSTFCAFSLLSSNWLSTSETSFSLDWQTPGWRQGQSKKSNFLWSSRFVSSQRSTKRHWRKLDTKEHTAISAAKVPSISPSLGGQGTPMILALMAQWKRCIEKCQVMPLKTLFRTSR